MFQRGAEIYKTFFKIDVEGLLKELDADIEATKGVKDQQQKQKEAKIQQMLAVFDIEVPDQCT